MIEEPYLWCSMKDADIRQKLHRYIETAKTKKVKAIYAILEGEIEEAYDYWNDEEFVAELQRREEDFRMGKSKSYTLDQAIKKAKQAIKTVHRCNS
jgi:predicted RNA-binding Zn ribbon-like protein